MGLTDINVYIEKIYEDTSSYLIKYITLKCRSVEDIQDILQNTYLGFIDTITKSKQSHTNILNPKHYLLRICKCEIAKFYKEKAEHDDKIVASTDDENYIEKVNDDFLEQDFTHDIEMSDLLWERVKSLGDITAKIFTLKFVYDETIERIAKQLCMTPSNVKNHLYRGLTVLREEMLSGGNIL